jgi:Cu(I)/Ag(I) efflux system membrane protein CusA/SilA
MHWQGINANIMSLGGIAIAIGAMIDGAIVMIENLHKHMERTPLNDANRWQVVAAAATEVGPALFFSLLIITVSFVPVFALEAQEGRMFSPLAFTKTYAMAASAALAVTVVPVLMGYFIRGRVVPEARNPLNRVLVRGYLPLLRLALGFPRLMLALMALLLVLSLWPLSQIGREFIPELDEGDLMYMPTTYAGLSIGKARELLQQTDRLIATVPEVQSVFGNAGRAETATDPAPLTMLETFIQLKPRDQWREGMSTDKLKQELDALVRFPGLSNAWVMPIKTRIDMLATGIRTPVGIKVAGEDAAQLQRIGQQLEVLLADLPGTASVYSERVDGGRYIKVDIQREQAARYGLNVADVQLVISSAIGGANITQTVEGRERYPVNLRYPQGYRDSPEQLALLPLLTPAGQWIALADVARVYVEEGPPMIKSENGRLNGWTLVDIEGVDVGAYVARARARVAEQLELPVGYSLSWSGQYEYMERAVQKLQLVIPLTLAIIVVLLYLHFRRLAEVAMILGTLPLALTGALWLMYLLGYNFSVAAAVGFIALAGVAVELGILMLSYLHQSCRPLLETAHSPPAAVPAAEVDTEAGRVPAAAALRAAVLQGAGLRIRPVAMTAVSTVAGLLPIMLSDGTGAEVVSRIAAPMVGGMLSAALLTLLVLPVVYYLWGLRAMRARD